MALLPAESAVLAALSAEAKAALKALLRDFADNEIPALVAAETGRLPAAYGPLAQMGFAAVYPVVDKALDARIDAI